MVAETSSFVIVTVSHFFVSHAAKIVKIFIINFIINIDFCLYD